MQMIQLYSIILVLQYMVIDAKSYETFLSIVHINIVHSYAIVIF